MRAAITETYCGAEVPRIGEVAPPEPRPGEVLVKVSASSVSRSDCGMLQGHPAFARVVIGLWRPKLHVLGLDFAGTVAGRGAGVTGYSEGDRVFGLSPEFYGGHAEYIAVPAGGAIARLPDQIPLHQAPICEGAWYARSCLEAVGLTEDQRILVYGGSGAIGSAAVQLAKARGAEVTAVAGTGQLCLMRQLGADRVVDYMNEDFTALGACFDVVLDAVGKSTYFACRPLLTPQGVFAATDLGPRGQVPLLSLWFAVQRRKRVLLPLPREAEKVPGELADLMGRGLYRPVIDSHFPMERIAEAYRHVLSETKTGVVVLDVAPEEAKAG